MPRGVYDRSKVKTQTETKKATGAHAAPAAHKPKGKPGRKPGFKASANKTNDASSVNKTAESRVSFGGDALHLFSTIRANIETLTLVSDKFGAVIPGINAEVAAHLNILSELRKQVFGTGEAQATQTDSTENVEQSAQTASNGTSGSPSYPTTVPMPPAPIPSIATH